MDQSLLPIGKAAKLLGISIDTLRRWDNNGKFFSIRVEGGNRYFRKVDVNMFMKDQLVMAKKWVKDMVGHDPEPEHFCKTRDVFQARLEHFQSEIIKTVDPNLSSLVSAIVGEIGNNSFDHNLGNWPDVLGIYFAYSVSQKRIILADRGLGVLATLRRTLPDLKTAQEALKIAFTQTVSGRAPENRGNGLKFVRNVVLKNPIKLYFVTGNAILDLDAGDKTVEIDEASETIRGCLAVIKY